MKRSDSLVWVGICLGFLLLLPAEGSELDVPEGDRPGKDYYVFLYAPGPGWVAGSPTIEQPFVQGHFNYMDKLTSEKVLIIGGPYKDDSGAMGIIEASSLEQARKIMESDPLVKNGTVTLDVRPWFPAVTGCIEKKNL